MAYTGSQGPRFIHVTYKCPSLFIHHHLHPRHPSLHLQTLRSGFLSHTDYSSFGFCARWVLALSTLAYSPFALCVLLLVIYHAVQAKAQDPKII